MFTGIIEEIGTVANIEKGVKSSRITICADKIFDDLKIGDSVSVNGMCSTAAQVSNKTFTADIMAESMRRTNLGDLKKGSKVNLERAMQLNGRFGGHIVSGHVDGTGIILSQMREDNAVWVTISADDSIMRYIIEKGSITVDGISLTVAKIYSDAFAVSIIPHTAGETTLLKRRSGEKVNLECDIVGKYIEKFVKKESNITIDFLKENNF